MGTLMKNGISLFTFNIYFVVVLFEVLRLLYFSRYNGKSNYLLRIH